MKMMQKFLFVLTFVAVVPVVADDGLALTETDQSITVTKANRPVLVYNKTAPELPAEADAIYARDGFLHPVASPQGQVVTGLYPADHRHQSGVFCAWVNTNYDGRKIDFWNLHRRQGRVVHRRVLSTKQSAEMVQFQVELIHRITQEPAVDVLRDVWTVTVHLTESDFHCFDIQTHQTALTDVPLVVNQHKYGGMAVRGRDEWLLKETAVEDSNPQNRASRFLTDKTLGRVAGNHSSARWVNMAGNVGSGEVAITALSHPTNFRSEQKVRLHPRMPYFCFAPCVDEEFVIDRDHPYDGRYRFLVTDAEPDAEWLQKQWAEWVD